MLDKVKELVLRPNYYEVTFKYESYGEVFVTCSIKRPYFKSLAVQKLGGDEEIALEKALKLLEEVKNLEKKIDIKRPALDKQQNVGGYYREILFEDYEVEFKRTGDSYVITDISRKDKNGFYIVDEEKSEHIFKLDEDYLRHVNITKYRNLLEEGEELWAWDNIGFLSGSAGIVVVKNNRVIKKMGLVMA